MAAPNAQAHLQALQALLQNPTSESQILTPEDIQHLPGRIRIPLLEQLAKSMATAAPSVGPETWQYNRQRYSPMAPGGNAGKPIGWQVHKGISPSQSPPAWWQASIADPNQPRGGNPNIPAGWTATPGATGPAGVTAPPGGPITGQAPGGGEGNKPPWYQTIPLGWILENVLRAVRDTGVGRQPKMP